MSLYIIKNKTSISHLNCHTSAREYFKMKEKEQKNI